MGRITSAGCQSPPPACRECKAGASWLERVAETRLRLDAEPLWFKVVSSIFTSGLDPIHVFALLEVAHLFWLPLGWLLHLRG